MVLENIVMFFGLLLVYMGGLVSGLHSCFSHKLSWAGIILNSIGVSVCWTVFQLVK